MELIFEYCLDITLWDVEQPTGHCLSPDHERILTSVSLPGASKSPQDLPKENQRKQLSESNRKMYIYKEAKNLKQHLLLTFIWLINNFAKQTYHYHLKLLFLGGIRSCHKNCVNWLHDPDYLCIMSSCYLW